ncbi:MAG: hypothetical protein LBD03_03050 [Methanobrevibacter sp.]|jgi:TM2 domain-containing membrane protein YozV|nr:hypothetical protein [Candidatus Methanovirga procula]
MDWMKQQMFKDELEKATDIHSLYMIGERYKLKNWWLSVIISGLGQMIQGRVGRGILLFLFGWITLGILYIYGIYDAYTYEKTTNDFIDMQILRAKKKLEENSEVI